jgi:hypothetical protein
MDSKLFRLPTLPNLVESVRSARPIDIVETARRQEGSAPDNRFPGWPSQMEDGRLVTDYQPHCANNIPAGKQFPTKAFMQKNTDSIIEMSRRISAKQMGANFQFDSSVVPGLKEEFSCSRSVCKREIIGDEGSIGIARRREPVPELFGTYTIPYNNSPPPKVTYTTRYEGGRNSLRGSGVNILPLV